MTRVGLLIKEGREEAGFTQGYLATLCQLQTPQYISNIERGTCGISLEVAQKLTTILPIKANELRTAMICDYSDRLKTRWGKYRGKSKGNSVRKGDGVK